MSAVPLADFVRVVGRGCKGLMPTLVASMTGVLGAAVPLSAAATLDVLKEALTVQAESRLEGTR